MIDAFHPQTILARDMNGEQLPERQLGYKHAKFVMRLEAVDSLDGIHGGKGGIGKIMAIVPDMPESKPFRCPEYLHRHDI